jgi:hypothetical protein
VSRRSNLRDFLQKLHIFTAAAELVVADQGRERSAAEDAELFFVDLLEEGALIELGRALQIAQKILLVDIEQLDLEHVVGFALVEQVLDAAPGAFQLLERGVVQNFVQLQRNEPSISAMRIPMLASASRLRVILPSRTWLTNSLTMSLPRSWATVSLPKRPWATI